MREGEACTNCHKKENQAQDSKDFQPDRFRLMHNCAFGGSESQHLAAGPGGSCAKRPLVFTLARRQRLAGLFVEAGLLCCALLPGVCALPAHGGPLIAAWDPQLRPTTPLHDFLGQGERALRLRGGGGLPWAKRRKATTKMEEEKSEKMNYARSGALLCAALTSTIALEMMSDWLYVDVFFGIQAYQLLISLGYTLFFCANLIPGRLDAKLGRPKREDLRFFTPAGFTFAIWAPIFLGELLMAISALAPDSLVVPGSSWLQDMAPSYAAASIYQALWCLAFREWALKYQWVPATLLTLAAVALYRAHFHIATSYSAGAGTIWSLVACRIPVALHFGWITAAAALSWNGQIAAMGTPVEVRLTAALATCFVAALFLGFTAISRREGWPALTASWALYGVSKGHEVLRGAVDNLAIDTLNSVATLCSGVCAGMASWAWLSFLSA